MHNAILLDQGLQADSEKNQGFAENSTIQDIGLPRSYVKASGSFR
jgi:hypothetical protein